jgi:hypothetical protein
MNEEMREAASWLNSREGRAWSRNRMKSNRNSRVLFCLKDDAGESNLGDYSSWGKLWANGEYTKPGDTVPDPSYGDAL